ncbi:MAG: hypothetical protein M3Q30_26925 [Actinomycetota bacterium]|nr:hypothetical protein [Actinomycetota bacterium]
MPQNTRQYVSRAPWLAVYAGASITLVVAAYNFVGDAINDALDPRS